MMTIWLVRQRVRQSLAITERLARANPKDVMLRRKLAHLEGSEQLINIMERSAKGEDVQEQLTVALGHFRRYLTLTERLIRGDPNNAKLQEDMSGIFMVIGSIQAMQANITGATESYRQSLTITERLAKENPDDLRLQHLLSTSLDILGHIQMVQGDPVGALDSYSRSLATTELLVKGSSNDVMLQSRLSASFGYIGNAQMAQGDLTSAIERYHQSLTIAENLARSDPGNAELQYDVATSYQRLADAGVPGFTWERVRLHLQAMKNQGIFKPSYEDFLVEAAENAAREQGTPSVLDNQQP
ncbi:MAG: hypothetical protein WCY92_07880 [Novosphingobium sp.]